MDSAERSRPQRLACRRCHARKVRCDAAAGQPCSGCRSSGTECVAHKKRRRNRGPPKPDGLPTILPTPTAAPDSSPGDFSWSEELPALVGEAAQETFDTPSVAFDSELGRAAATLSSLQDAPKDIHVERYLVNMLSQDDLNGRIMQKGVRIVYVGQEYSNMNYLIRHRARNEAVHHFPTDQISRQYLSHELDRIPQEAFIMPSPAVVDELLENYFLYVNPGFPIMDEEIFMSQYRNKDPLNPPSLLVLQAVLMVGAHVSRSRPDRDELKRTFFRRAKMLFDARFEWNRDVVVQAALLLTWHSEGVEDISANSYYWIGVAARTAHGLGMHRDTGPSTLIAHDKGLWRRLWWILVQFDVIVSLSYGRPTAVNLDDSDVPQLEASDFDAQNETVNVDFVIYHARLCYIMYKAMKERFGLKVQPARKKAALMEADQRLAEWMVALPKGLKGSSIENALSHWPAMLHINYGNFLVLLHRPPPKVASMANVTKPDDMGICSAAAASLITLFETLVARNKLRYMNVFAVDALFTALIQLSAETRVANPIISANAKERFDTALDILRSLAEYWLTAKTILRLFEDSSERMRKELRIGKSMSRRDAEREPEPPDSGVEIHQGELHLDGWQNLVTSPTTAMQHMGVLNDQLDWTNIYWENSGFNLGRPFPDMG